MAIYSVNEVIEMAVQIERSGILSIMKQLKEKTLMKKQRTF